MTDRHDIAILGCGMVTPFAADVGERVLAAAADARCDRDADYWAVPDDFLSRYADFGVEMKRDRASWITGAALTHARAQAGIELEQFPPERIALVLGSAFAGQLGMIDFATEVRSQSARFVSPIHFPQTVGNYVAGVLARAFKVHGPNLTLASGAASGLDAVARACALLRDNAADIAVAGGFEVLSAELVRGLGGSTFGDDHGRVWSEGACLYVLRRADDADARCAVIRDWSSTSDATPRDTSSIARLVGRSLAAESAMRLCTAINAPGAATERVITQTSDDRHTTSVVVARSG